MIAEVGLGGIVPEHQRPLVRGVQPHAVDQQREERAALRGMGHPLEPQGPRDGEVVADLPPPEPREMVAEHPDPRQELLLRQVHRGVVRPTVVGGQHPREHVPPRHVGAALRPRWRELVHVRDAEVVPQDNGAQHDVVRGVRGAVAPVVGAVDGHVLLHDAPASSVEVVAHVVVVGLERHRCYRHLVPVRSAGQERRDTVPAGPEAIAAGLALDDAVLVAGRQMDAVDGHGEGREMHRDDGAELQPRPAVDEERAGHGEPAEAQIVADEVLVGGQGLVGNGHVRAPAEEHVRQHRVPRPQRLAHAVPLDDQPPLVPHREPRHALQRHRERLVPGHQRRRRHPVPHAPERHRLGPQAPEVVADGVLRREVGERRGVRRRQERAAPGGGGRRHRRGRRQRGAPAGRPRHDGEVDAADQAEAEEPHLKRHPGDRWTGVGVVHPGAQHRQGHPDLHVLVPAPLVAHGVLPGRQAVLVVDDLVAHALLHGGRGGRQALPRRVRALVGVRIEVVAVGLGQGDPKELEVEDVLAVQRVVPGLRVVDGVVPRARHRQVARGTHPVVRPELVAQPPHTRLQCEPSHVHDPVVPLRKHGTRHRVRRPLVARLVLPRHEGVAVPGAEVVAEQLQLHRLQRRGRVGRDNEMAEPVGDRDVGARHDPALAVPVVARRVLPGGPVEHLPRGHHQLRVRPPRHPRGRTVRGRWRSAGVARRGGDERNQVSSLEAVASELQHEIAVVEGHSGAHGVSGGAGDVDWVRHCHRALPRDVVAHDVRPRRHR
mmetsp:Transcript_6570/g.12322  ORF Transcript_6570/g.12322 Transcript_6570/m.12322 type:complete len:772 (+) Transcript_6570:608-2923(+)